jgi:hypothetical protein
LVNAFFKDNGKGIIVDDFGTIEEPQKGMSH